MVAAALLLAGCGPPAPDRPACQWQALDTGFTVSTLAAAGDDLLIGGRSDTAPALMTAAGRHIPMEPRSLYGSAGILVQVAGDGHRVFALGNTAGGAHLNPRWTVWAGSMDGLVEEPQPVETFGGPNAGGLTALALDASGPLLLGSWSQPDGSIGGTLWGRTGSAWSQLPAAAPLAGAAGNRFLPTGIAVTADRLVIAGFLVSGNGLRAAIAIGERTGGWHLTELTSADSVATDVACDTARCVLVGRIGTALAGWELPGGSTAATPIAMPEQRVVGGSDTPRVTAGHGTVAVVVDRTAGTTTGYLQRDGTWSTTTLPAGSHRLVVGSAGLAALADGRAYRHC